METKRLVPLPVYQWFKDSGLDVREDALGCAASEWLMKKLTLAFYTGMGAEQGVKDKVASKAISWWTRSKMTHVELVFPDAVSFSSSGMDGGTRFKAITYTHPEYWYFVPLINQVNDREAIYINVCRDRAARICGAKYDWKGIFFHQFLPFRAHNKAEFWCSEAVAYALAWPPYQIPPVKLYDVAVRRIKGNNIFKGAV